MYLWLPVATCSVLTLARALIDWHGRIRYERVRAASTAALLQSTPAGGTLQDSRPDGTLLHIVIPARQTQEDSGNIRQVPGRPPC
jgi:hypothetical protein